ncbi:MAG: hypothetical protein ACI8QC_001672 [Planctomycetota bacterium]|jgi:hypothetical protein
MLKPVVKFEVEAGLRSRYQAWKFQVSPARIEVVPVGIGVLGKSKRRLKLPPAPEDCGGMLSSGTMPAAGGELSAAALNPVSIR